MSLQKKSCILDKKETIGFPHLILKEKGLVASYYSDEHKRGFVTDEMIDEIREYVARARFRYIWGKDMPDGMPTD